MVRNVIVFIVNGGLMRFLSYPILHLCFFIKVTYPAFRIRQTHYRKFFSAKKAKIREIIARTNVPFTKRQLIKMLAYLGKKESRVGPAHDLLLWKLAGHEPLSEYQAAEILIAHEGVPEDEFIQLKFILDHFKKITPGSVSTGREKSA